jgi:hypothetical protein
MKTDLYTKTVLTVIAVVLSINLLSDFDIMPKAYANDSTQSVVDVRIREIDPIMLGTLPVNIKLIGGLSFKEGGLPIDVIQLGGTPIDRNAGALPIDIKYIGGSGAANSTLDNGRSYLLTDDASKYNSYKY